MMKMILGFAADQMGLSGIVLQLRQIANTTPFAICGKERSVNNEPMPDL